MLNLHMIKHQPIHCSSSRNCNNAHYPSTLHQDLDPTPNTPAHRTWTWSTFALVWTSTILNPGSISCGAALLALGLNWLDKEGGVAGGSSGIG